MKLNHKNRTKNDCIKGIILKKSVQLCTIYDIYFNNVILDKQILSNPLKEHNPPTSSLDNTISLCFSRTPMNISLRFFKF